MYTQIMLPVDIDQNRSWEKALPAAVELCRAFGAQLTVITVVPGFSMSMVEQYFPPESQQRMIADTSAALEKFVAAQIPDDITAGSVVAEGKIYEEIIEAAQSRGVDLVVMGSHSPELKDYLLGPNAARVVRHAPTSVLVVR